MVASSFSVQLPFLDIFSFQDLVPYTPSNNEFVKNMKNRVTKF